MTKMRSTHPPSKPLERKQGSVAANFKVTAYSKLAPAKISNLCLFEYTYVYSNIHGHFVDDFMYIRIYMVILWMIIEYGPLSTAAP
jgi:hypothetical protein